MALRKTTKTTHGIVLARIPFRYVQHLYPRPNINHAQKFAGVNAWTGNARRIPPPSWEAGENPQVVTAKECLDGHPGRTTSDKSNILLFLDMRLPVQAT